MCLAPSAQKVITDLDTVENHTMHQRTSTGHI